MSVRQAVIRLPPTGEATLTQTTFGDILRVGEFRALWLADLQSWAGDQLGRVALSVLVFERTGSSAATAVVYGLTYLPAFLGGIALTGLADRIAPRRLMISCDLGRAAVFAAMAMPWTPLPLVAALLVVGVLLGAPFTAAEGTLLPRILDGERYVVGSGLRMSTGQIAQLAGFAIGGLLIAAVGPRWGLALDALTFAMSAVLVRAFVIERPPGELRDEPAGIRAYARSVAVATGLIAASPRLRTMLGFGWLAGCYIVPEGLAAPYAAAVGGGPAAIGILLAALPAGTALGSIILVRWVPPARRSDLIGPLAVLAGLALASCALRPGLAVSLALWTICGMFCAYQVPAFAAFVQATPNDRRGQALGLAASGLVAVQGLGIIAFGIGAERLGAPGTVALAGALGSAIALVLMAGEGARATPTARTADSRPAAAASFRDA